MPVIYDFDEFQYREYVVRDYKSSKARIDNIIGLFNGVYKDKTNMRKESYEYSIWSVDYPSETELKKGLATFAKPYQFYRVYNDRAAQLKWCRQYQMPAYFMQNFANVVHEYFVEKDDKGNFVITERINSNELINKKQKEFISAKMAFPYLGAKWYSLYAEGLYRAIDMSHYLESYYVLSKEINITAFR